MVSSNFCLSRHGYMKRESGCFSFTWKIIHGKKNSSRKRKFLNFLHILQMLESSILQMKTNLDALVLLNMRSTLKVGRSHIFEEQSPQTGIHSFHKLKIA